MLRVLNIVASFHVANCFIVGPRDTAQSAWDTFRAVCQLQGLSLEPAKGHPPASSIRLLGADVDLTAAGIHASLTGKKRRDWLSDILQIL